eukprot:6176190-Pleurochrysis_carterae.AAC.2
MHLLVLRRNVHKFPRAACPEAGRMPLQHCAHGACLPRTPSAHSTSLRGFESARVRRFAVRHINRGAKQAHAHAAEHGTRSIA